jgi:hypothetical protein
MSSAVLSVQDDPFQCRTTTVVVQPSVRRLPRTPRKAGCSFLGFFVISPLCCFSLGSRGPARCVDTSPAKQSIRPGRRTAVVRAAKSIVSTLHGISKLPASLYQKDGTGDHEDG